MNFYSKIANIIKTISSQQTSFKNAIYQNISNHQDEKNFTKIYKIIIEIVRYKTSIENIIDIYFSNEMVKDKELLKVFIYEYFFSDKKIKIGGKLMKLIKSKKDEISNYIEKNNLKIKSADSEIMHFRILNNKDINTLFGNEADDIENDEFIKDLFSINKKTHGLKKIFELRDNNDIIIQSKSSCIPAYLLYKYHKINTNFNIIDTCSAPGNKTLQLSQYFTKSKIFAYEINENRFNILKNNLDKYKATNVEPINKDFLSIDPKDKRYKDVKIILADPSCSGSGTQNNSLEDNRMNECCLDIAGSDIEEENIGRLKQLASFQYKILEHCMKFPNVKYISYSTCSIYMTENEYVVNKVLENHKQFKLLRFGEYEYNQFHKGLTEETKDSLRVCRKCHGIDGFYVAIFERIKN
jgi:putative methyltransferase